VYITLELFQTIPSISCITVKTIVLPTKSMSIEEKLKKLGLELPAPPNYKGNYIGAKFTDNIAFSCGQGPFATTKRGMIGKDLTIEEGYKASQETCLNCLAQLKRQLGSLDRIKQVLQVIGFVNSEEGFMDQPKVLNGFTDLLVNLFGDPEGKPARAALPLHHPGWIAVEAWMVVELKV
jgi:enamine deaminase RidA (YjgF/YER057c/UK114 family)